MKWLKNSWTRVLATLALVITIFSQLPFSMGDLSTYVPVKYRVSVFLIGLTIYVVAKVIQQPPKPTITSSAPTPPLITSGGTTYYITNYYDNK